MNSKKCKNTWLVAAGLTLGLTVPFTANAHFQSDPGTNLVLGAAATYALIEAADGFDRDKDRRRHGHRGHRGDRRHDGRPFHSRHGHHGHRGHHGHHRGHGYRHAYRHGVWRGYRHGRRHAHGYPGRTYPPRWYAYR